MTNKIDLYVANDMSANYLFRNLGSFRFEETGAAAGASASADGLYKSGMGIACGDLDGDELLDLAVTNYFGESTTFYRNLGGGLFADHTALVGLLGPSRPLLGFGIAFPEVDNDGWLDVLSSNGHVQDSRPRIPWDMPLQLMMGGPGGHLIDVSDRAGESFRKLHLVGVWRSVTSITTGVWMPSCSTRMNHWYTYTTTRKSQAISSGSAWRVRNRIAMASGPGSRLPLLVGAGCRSGSAGGAINRRAIPGSTLAWEHPAGRMGRGAVAVGTCRSPRGVDRGP